MYLYKINLGGFYASDKILDQSESHREQHDGSDKYLGYFTKNEAEKFWQMYKPSSLPCIGCQKLDEECEKCHDNEGDGSFYLLRDLMTGICENFVCPKKSIVTTLIHNTHNNSYFFGCEFKKDKETGVTVVEHVPYQCPCYKDEIADKVAIDITPYADSNIGTDKLPSLVFSCKINDVRNIVYLINGDFGETNPESLEYTGEMWAGWIPAKEINFRKEFNFLAEQIET